MLIKKLFTLYLILSSFNCFSGEPHEYQNYFETMTYSSDIWREDDFGKLPTKSEIRILKKYSPQFSISKTACLPMNFYEQYVPLLFFKKKSGEVIRANRKNIKRFERNSSVNWLLEKSPKCIQDDEPPPPQDMEAMR